MAFKELWSLPFREDLTYWFGSMGRFVCDRLFTDTTGKRTHEA